MKDKLAAAIMRRKTPMLFVASSLALSAADFVVYNLFDYVLLPGNTAVSVMAGRVTGALVGFLINRGIVFRGAGGRRKAGTAAFVKYAVLWTANYFAAQYIISFAKNDLRIEAWLAWFVAALLLYVPNYLLQRYFVFRRRPDAASADAAAASKQ